MNMRGRYGDSKILNCPFCGKQAITKNNQGIPVCMKHKHDTFDDIKCACGEYLDIRTSKWGAYFHCVNCGNISFHKGIEMKDL